MLSQKNIISILNEKNEYLRNIFGVKRIGIFGSFAKEEQKEESDIDIYVEFERPIGFKFIDLADYIEKLLGRKIDILTPEGVRSIRIEKIAKDIERSIRYV